MTIKIKGVNTVIDISSITSYEVVIMNSKLFYQVGKELSLLDSDEIILYNGDIIDNEKHLIPLTYLFNIDSNNKKALTATYKLIAKNMNSEISNDLNEINIKILELMMKISYDFNCETDYDDSIKIEDLLSTYSFKFYLEDESFLKIFITYVKSLINYRNIKAIFVYDLGSFVNQEEFILLINELKYLGVSIINLTGNKSNLLFENRIIIDNDLCEY